MTAVEWTALGVVFTIICTLGGMLVRALDRLNHSETKADAAEKVAQAATIATAGMTIEIDRIKSDLVEHRVAVAKEYVSKDTLASLENRVVAAINQLGERLDRMFNKSAH